jgi:hypothetical protein
VTQLRYDIANLTFYGFDDNDDGRGHYGTAVIAYPKLHDVATEDLGTFERPATFATEKHYLAPGSVIYVPRLRKYWIMEDGCVECSDDWKKGIKHIDLYIGGHKLGGKALIDREEELTLDGPELIILDPPSHLPVDQTPLFRGNRETREA